MRLPRIDAFVFEALQANAGADFVLRLIDAFAEEAPRLLVGLQQAAAAGDGEAFETAAHTLKSNGIAFGATRLAEMARRVEWQGLTAPAAEIDALAAELADTLTALRALSRQ